MAMVREAGLQGAWQRRVAENDFSAVVVATRSMRIFGSEGALFQFPQLRELGDGESWASLLGQLEPDERWALAYARRMVADHAAAGRQLYAVARDQGVGVPMRRFDPTAPRDILIL